MRKQVQLFLQLSAFQCFQGSFQDLQRTRENQGNENKNRFKSNSKASSNESLKIDPAEKFISKEHQRGRLNGTNLQEAVAYSYLPALSNTNVACV